MPIQLQNCPTGIAHDPVYSSKAPRLVNVPVPDGVSVGTYCYCIQLQDNMARSISRTGQEFAVGGLSGLWVGEEKVPLLEGVGYEAEGALPGAMEQIESSIHSLPVCQMEEAVGYGLGVTALEYMFRGQNQWLHLQ